MPHAARHMQWHRPHEQRTKAGTPEHYRTLNTWHFDPHFEARSLKHGLLHAARNTQHGVLSTRHADAQHTLVL